MSLKYKEIDLLLSGAQFLAHQCNCSTRVAKGLAAAVFAVHPRANTYACGEARHPGTIDVFLPEVGSPGVINCNAQRGPGRPRGEADSVVRRLAWFQECLKHISELEGLESVAFPHSVGCGMAGGNWSEYERLLISFAESMPAVDVVVCKLPKSPRSRGVLPPNTRKQKRDSVPPRAAD